MNYKGTEINKIATAKIMIELFLETKNKGLLALKKQIIEKENDFIEFSIDLIFELFEKDIDSIKIYEILNNYNDGTCERKLIIEGFVCMIEGYSYIYVKELFASILGYENRNNFLSAISQYDLEADVESTRDKIIKKYKNKKCYSKDTELLEFLSDVDEKVVIELLKNLENNQFKNAMVGVSGNLIIKICGVMDDDFLLKLLDEDISNANVNEESIIIAQKKILGTYQTIINKRKI
ncbi:MAG: hypothetical protein LBR68_05990 [Lachnoclostridium sp.]|jgi:hypothetical protein|nr:hypothetical protein [Lachnoclostridium sp.]